MSEITIHQEPSSSTNTPTIDPIPVEPQPPSINTTSPTIFLGSGSYFKRKLGLNPKKPIVVLGDDILAKKRFTILAWEVLESAGQVAVELNSKVVKPEHIFKCLLKQTHGLAGVILSKLGVDVNDLQQHTNEFIQNNPTNESNKEMKALMTLAHDYRKKFKAPLVSPDHIFLAFADDKRIGKSFYARSEITKEKVAKCIKEINKSENKLDAKAGDYKGSQAQSLFTECLITKAKAGKLDPVIGRDSKIHACIEILQTRNRSNPLLIGKPGVGKTAIVEGMAQKIMHGDVPDTLVNCTILSLDMAALMAGASNPGIFVERLKSVLHNVEKSNGRIILFIDEIHLLIGTGAHSGPMDAANILKPLLARGDICCIGATTLNEYQRYFERDAALARRFRIVFVEQPSIKETIIILRGLQETYELHHGVRIAEGVLKDIVMYSDRYISGHYFPDKAIDLLDQAAAYLKTKMINRPSIFDEYEREISELEHGEKSDEVGQKLSILKKDLDNKLKQWEYEKTVINHIQLLKKQIREVKEKVKKFEFERKFDSATDLKKRALSFLLHQLNVSTEKFDEQQSKVESIIRDKVFSNDIGRIISERTGIPVLQLLEAEKENLLRVSDKIRERFVGQDDAVKAVARAMQASYSQILKPNRPICSLMFLGPPGVGKTELAKVLAYCIFLSEEALVRFNMSEFKDSSSVTKLLGAAPGLVGYETRGLFESVRMRPYSVVLFDEIEKSHENVRSLLLQILSDGRVTDSHKSVISFTNTIIIMTSNVGGQEVLDYKTVSHDILDSKVKDCVKKNFTIEFIDRLDNIIVFQPLTLVEIISIARLQLANLKQRAATKKIELQFDDAVARYIGEVAHAASYGGREVDRVIRGKIEAEYNILVLQNAFKEGDIVHVSIEIEQDKEIVVFKNIAS